VEAALIAQYNRGSMRFNGTAQGTSQIRAYDVIFVDQRPNGVRGAERNDAIGPSGFGGLDRRLDAEREGPLCSDELIQGLQSYSGISTRIVIARGHGCSPGAKPFGF